MSFPEGFTWGVSTAAYQIEGAVTEGGRGESIWDRFSHTPGRVFHGDTGDIACDHYHRLEEDLDLLSGLGVQVYRFSLAWPRIQPDGRGPANPDGVAFYNRLIDGLLERGIKPVPTLYHWDLPQSLQDEGGWANRAIVERFAEYADLAFASFGDRVDMWTTINEPWVITYFGYRIGIHAPGICDPAQAAAVHHHLLLAHAAAVERYRASGGGGAIGIALNLMAVNPTTDHPDDVAAARLGDAQLNTSFLQPLFDGGYPEALTAVEDYWSLGGGIVEAGDMERLVGKTDFLSINNYHPRYVCSPGRVPQARALGFDGGHEAPMSFGLPMIDVFPGTAAKTLMGWIIEPSGLRELLVRLGRDYPQVPLYISENGAAFPDYADQSGEVRDEERVAFLSSHIGACAEAIAAGVDLRGYWLWSFMDNFEWSCGYGQRFGIVHVEYSTLRRTPKASYRWYRETIRNHAIPAA